MIIFNFIFSIIIILIIYFLISSILKYLLKIFNKYEYKNYYLFLPTFLAMGTWSLGFLMWYFTLTYLMNIDIIKIIISFIIKEPSISNQVLIVSFIYWILCLLIQSFAFMTININYKKIIGNTRFTFKKLFKIREITNKNLTLKDDPDKINPITAFFISILTFFIICILVLILFFIGYLISRKLV